MTINWQEVKRRAPSTWDALLLAHRELPRSMFADDSAVDWTKASLRLIEADTRSGLDVSAEVDGSRLEIWRELQQVIQYMDLDRFVGVSDDRARATAKEYVRRLLIDPSDYHWPDLRTMLAAADVLRLPGNLPWLEEEFTGPKGWEHDLLPGLHACMWVKWAGAQGKCRSFPNPTDFALPEDDQYSYPLDPGYLLEEIRTHYRAIAAHRCFEESPAEFRARLLAFGVPWQQETTRSYDGQPQLWIKIDRDRLFDDKIPWLRELFPSHSDQAVEHDYAVHRQAFIDFIDAHMQRNGWDDDYLRSRASWQQVDDLSRFQSLDKAYESGYLPPYIWAPQNESQRKEVLLLDLFKSLFDVWAMAGDVTIHANAMLEASPCPSEHPDEGMRAFQLVNGIDRDLAQFVIRVLKKHHGDDWWAKVPITIRLEASRLQQRSGSKCGPDAYVNIRNWGHTIEENWDVFEAAVCAATRGANRRDATKWVYDVHKMRNRISHPRSEQPVSGTDLECLREARRIMSQVSSCL